MKNSGYLTGIKMKSIKFSVIVLSALLVSSCAGGAKDTRMGHLCQTQPSKKICALPQSNREKPVGTGCSCTHYGMNNHSFTETGVVIAN
jgi:hypothetical protein